MTMNAGYTVSPASLDLRDHPKDRTQQPHRDLHQNYSYNYNQGQKGPATPIESHLLSPYSSHVRSNSASPTGNFNTPADTASTIDIYQSSDLSSDFGDPFLGVDFDQVENGLPQFLEGYDGLQEPIAHYTQTQDFGIKDTQYPLSPHQTPSIPSRSAFGGSAGANAEFGMSVGPQHFSQTQPSTNSVDSNQSVPQLTPDTNGDSFSSDENLAPTSFAMATQSPRVLVSMWNRDEEGPIQGVERSFTAGAESPHTVHASHSLAGDLAGDSPRENLSTVTRDGQGSWLPNSAAGYKGLAPGNRPSEEVPSPNQQAANRERAETNKKVYEWVSRSAGDPSGTSGGAGGSSNIVAGGQDSEDDNIPSGEIPFGDPTENRHIPGQTYLHVDGPGGPLTQTDYDIMRQLQTWGDAPAIHAIQSDQQFQPATSQAAIEKFNRQCQDNESIVSRAATWGTRRRSLPSVVDMEGIISGSFLKKLSLSHSRRPSFIKKIPGLVRKPSASQLLKRKGSNASEVPPEDFEDQDRRDSKDTLAPPSRTSSWGISGISGITKKPTPSLNTALVGIATGAAAIGTTHARSGSISATSMTSPKSPFGSLSVPPVKNALRRPRSKTELPRSSNHETLSHPNLVGMLKKQGGPPVASLGRHQPAVEQDNDEDDDDDDFDDTDMKSEPNRYEAIEPTFLGFREHILRLNAGLPSENAWLADRIAHQMIMRYKQLQTAKVKHLKQVKQRNCPCRSMCIALGGSAIPLDSKGGERGFDPLSARPESSDGDTTPLEGGINSESFPPGIPMPPTMSLPAEFECQLCFSNKKFQKPSDWTKHVHEDVQPFTCTWEKCREPKMFKRKADWVRHENEGHRHLEWWTCDVDDCRHICYRRDNFLQHLVREHKFTEPKIKTKAAIKKAGGGDRTWIKVEQCHVETQAKPSDEPCRFCRKTFPTWKKLTVHLAKHMEHISLPVLKLVDTKELDADTIISPVQDPPRPNFPTPMVKQEPVPHDGSVISNQMPIDYPQPNNIGFGFQLQNTYYGQPPQMTQPFTEMNPNQGSNMMMAQNYQHHQHQPQYQHVPVTTGPAYDPSANAYMNLQPHPQQEELEPFPRFDLNPLGIQDATGSLGYESLANTGMQPVEQYTSHPGSVSPYGHSPHQGHSGTFYNP
ncbi:hypothetical protein F4820DRAFT_71664 [Hypoxylon rubiginosum]|uniref:Uncharacterized protein n=1 Tax=Hypoxylon rubiginosum TaxID=110542 RepID=A0ACB9YPI2_9PEZI|nr:hypothetical protein F4820DRAFT_71664 [Hypoxylon rubiginosum]